MSRLASVLFPEPTLRRSPLRLWQWWETRRVTYNLVVGTAGLVTVGVVQLALVLPGHLGPPVFPWPVVIAYGIAANVCYSLGWLAESVVQKWLGRETYGLGPALYRHGLVFSVGLTLFPAALISIGTMARIITLLVR